MRRVRWAWFVPFWKRPKSGSSWKEIHIFVIANIKSFPLVRLCWVYGRLEMFLLGFGVSVDWKPLMRVKEKSG